MSETCCTPLAWDTGCTKSPKISHLGTIAQLCRTISLQLTHVSTIGRKLELNSNISSTCPYNMVNIGLLAAEICWWFWGTPANFNGFRVLAALLHGYWASAKFCGVEQRAPPIFGRAAITLGIGPHSSFCYCCCSIVFVLSVYFWIAIKRILLSIIIFVSP